MLDFDKKINEIDKSLSDGTPSILSKPAEKARNRLLFTSLAVMFISLFNPTFTGFLGQLSIQITKNHEYFHYAVVLLLLWLFFRYSALVSRDHISSLKKEKENFLPYKLKSASEANRIWLFPLNFAYHIFPIFLTHFQSWESVLTRETITQIETLKTKLELMEINQSAALESSLTTPKEEIDYESRYIAITKQIEELENRLESLSSIDAIRNYGHAQLVLFDVIIPALLPFIAIVILLENH